MRKDSILVAVFCVLFLGHPFTASAQQAEPVPMARFDGRQVIRVDVQTAEQMQALEAMGLDLWSCHPRRGAVDFMVTPEQKDAVATAGFDFRTYIENVQALIDGERVNVPRGAGFFSDYHPYDEIVTYLNGLAAAHPGLAEMVNVGTSLEGRTIWAIRVTGPDNIGSKPAIFFHGTQHAREWIASMVPCYIADRLLNQYGVDGEITELVDSVEWYLLPVLNPDGYEYTHTTNRLWRKNRRNNGDLTYGVDLNRNWGYGWGDDSGSSAFGSSEQYRGTAPFSEPETQAARDFVLAHPNLVAEIDFHNYSQMILWPFASTEELSDHDGTFAYVGGNMQQAIFDVHGKNYTAGPTYTTIYPVSGGSTDWFYGDQGMWAFGWELRDTGIYGFLLPPEQIIPTCEENLQAVLFLTQWVTNPIWIQPSPFLPSVIPSGSATTVTSRVIPIADVVDPAATELYYRESPADVFAAIAMAPMGGEMFAADLPPAGCGSTPEFYFAAASVTGGSASSPVDAPVDSYFYDVVDMPLADNFETDQGWTVSGDASAGHWERGVPANGLRGDPSEDFDGSGQCYLTENAAGNSDVDGGTTILTSPVMDLSGGATITFGVWFNDYPFGLLGEGDVLTVEAATDAAGTNWQLLQTYDTAHYEWRSASIDVGIDIPATETVRVRFSVSDMPTGDIVEAAIDAFNVTSLNCGTMSVPGDVTGDGEVNLLDFATFAGCFGFSAPGPICAPAEFDASDIDGSGTIDLTDFATLALNFEQ